MGSVTKYKGKKGITYRAQVYVDGTRDTKTFTDEIEARIWIRDREHQLRTGEVPPGEIASDDKLFCDAVKKFIVETHGQVSRSQSANYDFASRPLVKFFGESKKMSEITKTDMLEYMIYRQRKVGVSSIRNELSLVRKVYEHAQAWGVSYPSPEREIKRPTRRKPSREESLDKIVSVDELNAIFSAAKQRNNNLYYYLRFLLFSGMRPTEAASLYWERLPAKVEKEYIKKRLPVGYISQGGFRMIGTKTQPRFVPAHPELSKIILQLRNTRKTKENGELNKLVFLDDKYINRVTPYKYYRRSFGTSLKHAKINKTINFYTFRHTFRSQTAASGIPTEISEIIMGHDTDKVQYAYVHLADSVLIQEIGKLRFDGLCDG